MEIKEYLGNLGWDLNKWTIKKEGEWEHLGDIRGYQNHVFAISDPVGKKEFGKNARVVNMEFLASNPAPAPAQAEPVAEATPPPPVPEKLKEIADASPNIVLATVPPVPAPPKAEEETHLERRIKVLIGRGLKVDRENKVLIDPDGVQLSFAEIEATTTEDWMDITVYYTPKNIRDRQEAAAANEKADADMEEMVYAGREKALIEEAGFVANHEKEAFYSPTNVEFTFDKIRKESDESFAKLLSFYKKEKEAEEARQATAQKLRDAKEKAEKEEAEAKEKFRKEQEAKALETEKEKKRLEYEAIKKKAIEQQRAKDDAEIDKYEAEKKAAEELMKGQAILRDNYLKKQAEEEAIKQKAIDDDARAAAEEAKRLEESKEADKSQATTSERLEILDTEDKNSSLITSEMRHRNRKAGEILVLLIQHGQATKPAKELAKYAYDLVDEMIKLGKQ